MPFFEFSDSFPADLTVHGLLMLAIQSVLMTVYYFAGGKGRKKKEEVSVEESFDPEFFFGPDARDLLYILRRNNPSRVIIKDDDGTSSNVSVLLGVLMSAGPEEQITFFPYCPSPSQRICVSKGKVDTSHFTDEERAALLEEAKNLIEDRRYTKRQIKQDNLGELLASSR